MPTFAYRVLPPREEFWATLDPGELALMVRHLDHLRRLKEAGAVRFVGRADDAPEADGLPAAGGFGLVLIEAGTAAEARRIARSDPAVTEGLMRVELHPFTVVMGEPAPSGRTAERGSPPGRSGLNPSRRTPMAKIDMKPPATVAREAAKGLRLHEASGKGGTEVGWARARQLADREELSRDDVVAMASYFARHEVDKDVDDWGNDDDPTPGYVAWLLWGGEPGREWADKTKARLEEAEG